MKRLLFAIVPVMGLGLASAAEAATWPLKDGHTGTVSTTMTVTVTSFETYSDTVRTGLKVGDSGTLKYENLGYRYSVEDQGGWDLTWVQFDNGIFAVNDDFGAFEKTSDCGILFNYCVGDFANLGPEWSIDSLTSLYAQLSYNSAPYFPVEFYFTEEVYIFNNLTSEFYFYSASGSSKLVATSPVPVPAAAPLLLAGLGALGFAARRRKSA